MEKSRTNQLFNQHFGQFVKNKRLALNWSQANLADKVGNNYQNISRLERGEISPTLLWCYKLSEAFDMDLAELIKEFNYKPKT